MSALVLAIPSKGRLKEQAENFLADCGLKLTMEARGYTAKIKSAPDVEVRLLSSSEIAQALRNGVVHAGVCGEDLLRETEPAMTRVELARTLGFGGADLVVAVPQSWVDVRVMADLDAVCHDFRLRQGKRLRVATKYHALARGFFDAHGLDDYRLVHSEGATEGAPSSGAAEAIVDITTTGATLAANHLKILDDGLILRSEAQLAVSKVAAWSEAARGAFDVVRGAIEARLRAKSHRVITASFETPTDFAALAKALKVRLIRASGSSADFECANDATNLVAARLAQKGAKEVLVTAPSYIFATP